MNERNDLARLAEPLVATPPIPPTPVGELRRRAARRTRRRMTAIGVAALVVLIGAGTALGLSGREAPPVQVGTGPGSTVSPAFDMEIFLDPRATPTEISSLERALLADPNVTGLVYSTQADSYLRFQCLFSDQPQLVESVQPEDLPASFEVDFVGGKGEAIELEQFVSRPGVKDYSFPPGSRYRSLTTETSVSIPPGAVRGGMVYETSTTIRSCPTPGTTLR